MNCSIDYGSSVLRSLFRNPASPSRLCLSTSRSEYAVVPDTDSHRRALGSEGVPFAVCEGSLLVIGNDASRVRWISRLPASPLFADGRIPQTDAPARQMLYELTQAMLPELRSDRGVCVMTIPGAGQGESVTGLNAEFLTRLVRMRGYTPLVLGAAEAAMLSAGVDSRFTGVSVVIGAESVSWCVARRGLVLATDAISAGTRWMDLEIARAFGVQVWDASGRAYLDAERAGEWRRESCVDLRQPRDEQESLLSRLYAVLVQKLAEAITVAVGSVDPGLRPLEAVPVVLAGGGSLVAGLVDILRASLREHETGQQRYAVKVAANAETAVVRGAYVYSELELAAGRPGAAA